MRSRVRHAAMVLVAAAPLWAHTLTTGADREYIGSVIVAESNGRFFEPAPGRTWLAGISAALTFR